MNSRPPAASRAEIRLASRALGHDLHRIELSVPGVHCAGCIGTVENGLARLAGVEHVRVNLSTRRASVTWRGDEPPDLIAALETLGSPAIPPNPIPAARTGNCRAWCGRWRSPDLPP
jgi:Cu2+-exporting ATPase